MSLPENQYRIIAVVSAGSLRDGALYVVELGSHANPGDVVKFISPRAHVLVGNIVEAREVERDIEIIDPSDAGRSAVVCRMIRLYPLEQLRYSDHYKRRIRGDDCCPFWRLEHGGCCGAMPGTPHRCPASTSGHNCPWF